MKHMKAIIKQFKFKGNQFTRTQINKILTTKNRNINMQNNGIVKQQLSEKYQKHQNSYVVWLLLGLAATYLLQNRKAYCIDKHSNLQKTIQQNHPSNQLLQNNEIVQIFQLNKNQLVQLLSNINEQSLLIVFNKYFRSQKQKQFAKKLEEKYTQCQQLKIKKIFLIDQNDIKHLKIFQKWIRNQQESGQEIVEKQQQNKQQKKDKQPNQQYYYLTPDFKNNPFKIDEQNYFVNDITQIRKLSVLVNPKHIRQQIFTPYKNIFNRTTVIKQCPQFVSSIQQNQCIQQFRKNVATLIEQKMLKNKSDEFRFYAFTPSTKKDNADLASFNKEINKHINQQNLPDQKSKYSQKQQHIFVLRNDILGREIDNMKIFKKRNYKTVKNLTNYQKFLLFIKPRVFLISKGNTSIDLYWYVTVLHKNKQPSISINNTDSFLLGRQDLISSSNSSNTNNELQFLKILHQNHPQLNYVVVNSQSVYELIRHTATRNKYAIYNLTSDIMYPKMFLPLYNQQLSPLENYKNNFRPLIETYLNEPKVYDRIVLDQEKKIGATLLAQLIKQKSQENKFILRVCSKKCQSDLDQQKMKKVYKKWHTQLNNNEVTNIQTPSVEQKQSDIILSRNWKNYLFANTYWIDSYFNNVGLKDGDYIFQNKTFSKL